MALGDETTKDYSTLTEAQIDILKQPAFPNELLDDTKVGINKLEYTTAQLLSGQIPTPVISYKISRLDDMINIATALVLRCEEKLNPPLP